MKCIRCGEKTTVTDSRKGKGIVIRTRKCRNCGKVVRTMEQIDDSEELKDEYRVIRKMRVAELALFGE